MNVLISFCLWYLHQQFTVCVQDVVDEPISSSHDDVILQPAHHDASSLVCDRPIANGMWFWACAHL